MQLLMSAARWEVIFLITSFTALALLRLFKDGSFAGLLRAGDRSFSPARVQMLMITMLTAMQYLLSTIHDPTHLPSVPASLVAVLGGSQSLYLGAKAWDIYSTTKKQEK